ncbi:bacteriohemerythrin [Telmatospirillum sp.]|uniref:bacteriohemerythrin n=1 Tax=Telmatospirillum sp. TaxID=2079197 RepID=UPI00283B7887|nr:bacteriohemerythrin [Telmatospirillum sp.]MDR3435471.1 bacteriohemerythrin [Telmatospirillum sp.]
MELGEQQIDGEHAAQIRLLDTFEEKLKGSQAKDDLVIVLDRLVEFTNLHFMSEEMLMQQHAYPALGLHVKEHDHLLDQVRVMQDAFNCGDQTMTAAELVTLRDWLMNHIRTKDRAFTLYLEERKREEE